MERKNVVSVLHLRIYLYILFKACWETFKTLFVRHGLYNFSSTFSKNKNDLFPSKGLLYPPYSISCWKNSRCHRAAWPWPCSQRELLFPDLLFWTCVFLWYYWKKTTFFLSWDFFFPLCFLNKCSAMNKVNIAVSLSAYFSVCFIIQNSFKRNTTHGLGWFPASLKVHWHFSEEHEALLLFFIEINLTSLI